MDMQIIVGEQTMLRLISGETVNYGSGVLLRLSADLVKKLEDLMKHLKLEGWNLPLQELAESEKTDSSDDGLGHSPE